MADAFSTNGDRGFSESHLASIPIDDGALEVADLGSGEPLVLIQSALTADEFRPIADRPELLTDYRVILYHRRGYAGSSPADGAVTIARDADDCRRLIGALGIDRAHVAGLSYSAAVALELACSAPEIVHTLTLLEPPPLHTASGAEFRDACENLLEEYRRWGPAAALARFAHYAGPDWTDGVETLLPGASAQAERDADTFFRADIPALLAWQFGPERAAGVRMPVLYVGGADSGRWFQQVRSQMLEWLPHAEGVVLPGAGHSLALTHPAPIAAAMRRFLRRHPMGAAPPP